MPILTVVRGDERKQIAFEGAPLLSTLLAQNGFPLHMPCGGRGQCGKCAVRARGAVSLPTQRERRAGTRLACMTVCLGDCEVELNQEKPLAQIEQSSAPVLARTGRAQQGRYGAAVDIGTTTLALRLYDLQSGELLSQSAGENPQRAVADDVMGRIGRALAGQGVRLRELLLDKLDELLRVMNARCGAPDHAPEVMVVTGNTAMLYLLTGRSPQALSRAPFAADHLFDEWTLVQDKRAYLPPCVSAFVGADITCAVLASGMCGHDETALLCDIGTNGELALWHNRQLYVCSTAAGPAFEGCGITMGCGSVPGAIDKVWTAGGQLYCHAIDELPPEGICGSGVIDTVAALLQLEEIDETGAMESEERVLTGDVRFTRADVRAVQLAKAAIAAGMQTLTASAGIAEKDVQTLYIAGGFGSHMNAQSARIIGMIPQGMTARTVVLGNAALAGASQLLLDAASIPAAQAIAQNARTIQLGGNPGFNQRYMDNMMFSP